jgi:thiol:disulfide interchange protein DsbD
VSIAVSEFKLRSTLEGVTDGSLILKIQIETFKDFHIYKDRLEFSPSAHSTGKWQLFPLKTPQSIRFLDPITHESVEGYSGQSEFIYEARLTEALKMAPLETDILSILTGVQICNKNVCLLPVIVHTDVPLVIKKTEPKLSLFEKLSRQLKEHVGEQGQLTPLTILILFMAGLFTAFTPCVYPLYPITLGLFGRWAQSSHIPAFLLALVYCASMTLSYAVLGMLSATSGIVFGSLTQTPAFLMGVGFILILSSVFFSGLVQIPVPSKLINLVGKASSPGKSTWSYFSQAAIMGVSLGIVGSPCVGPVLLSLLAWLGAAVHGGGEGVYLRGFLLLSVFGIGMSTPFLILGHFILKLHRRPKLGFLTPWAKTVGAILMAASSLFFIVPGIKILRAKNAPAVEAHYPVLNLQNYEKENKHVWTLIDFRADWCAACI